MKKFIFYVLVLFGLCISKPLVLEICNSNFCYEQIINDAKKWEYKQDYTGKKFIRVYFYDNRRLLDISADGKTVKVKK
jgi:hypothetical protein